MSFQPTDPVTARQIAEHAVMSIQDLRACTALDEIHARHRQWLSFADSMGVCRQIREHILGVVNECAIVMKARQRPMPRQVSP